MTPRSPIYDLLIFYDTWEPVASLAQDTDTDYTTVYANIARWREAGLVETRIIRGALSDGRHFTDQRVEVRIRRPRPDHTWRDEAACIGADPDIFFPTSAGRGYPTDTRTALALCRQCTVRTQCLDYALNAVPPIGEGVWGGYTAAQRKRLRKELTALDAERVEPLAESG